MIDQMERKLVNLAFSSKTNIEFEEKMREIIYQEISKVVSRVFEEIDNQLVTNTKAKGYEIERRDNRIIQFLFGDVEFSRRLYKKGKSSLYALDDYLGFEARVRYSQLVQSKITRLTSRGEFAKISEAVNMLTPLSISAHGVHQITQRVSQKIKNYEECKGEFITNDKKKLPVLYLEGDAILIKDRSGKGELLTLHRYQVHEGVIKNGNRSKCINKYLASGFSRKKAFNEMLNYLHSHYDLSNTIILSCSDGGSGYEPSVFYELALGCKHYEHFLDRYHLMRKIDERTYFCKQKLVDKLKRAIRSYSKKDVDLILDTMESIADVRKDSIQAIEYIRLLRRYIRRNWKYIKPIGKRELPGIENYKGLGTFESNHRPFSYRMKKQGRAWSKKGAENMVRVINSINNGDFSEAISVNWEKKLEKILDIEVDMRELLNNEFENHQIKQGRIVNYGSSSSSFCRFKKRIME